MHLENEIFKSVQNLQKKPMSLLVSLRHHPSHKYEKLNLKIDSEDPEEISNKM